jgi:hypothetical protein
MGISEDNFKKLRKQFKNGSDTFKGAKKTKFFYEWELQKEDLTEKEKF